MATGQKRLLLSQLRGQVLEAETSLRQQAAFASTGAAGTFCLLRFIVAVELRWQDGSEDGRFSGTLPSMGSVSQQTFTGHVFKVINNNASPKLRTLATFTISGNRTKYFVPPDLNNSAIHRHPSYIAYLQANSADTFLERLTELQKRGGLDELSTLADEPKDSGTEGFSVTFYNFRSFPLELYFDDGSPTGKFTEQISPMKASESQSTYISHPFKLVRRDGERLELVQRFVMQHEIRHYVVEPETQDATHPEYLKFLDNREFAEKYFQSTGIHWTGPYPAVAPSLPLYAAGKSIGEHAHTVTLRPESRESDTASSVDLIALTGGFPEGPRVFLIRDVLSPAECEYIVSLAEPRLDVSKTGIDGRTSALRTSKTAFLEHNESLALAKIHRRFADILNITDHELSMAGEPLQVVRYEQGQQYQVHHDFTQLTQRLATLLVYLDEPSEGGGTSFPRAFGQVGMKVTPKRGSAILFYSQYPDGNLDEMALHAGMPVQQGVKRVCNLWLHSHADRHWSKEREEAQPTTVAESATKREEL
eukprot:TRINITY_DN18021_c0_g1_i2.p1 TRINITY_DN18021_c0_g1~~TRINITY_DN18021_c0_g1_i2.p1  ORF type:complete len:547 (-),score=69.59 TRINITY_DN18021_c0_g1_i2:61-1662(-)